MKNALLCVALSVLAACTVTQAKGKSNAPLQAMQESGMAARTECASMEPLDEETIKRFLYQARTYWDALGAYIMDNGETIQVLNRDIVAYYPVQNREFMKYFNNAIMLYLRGDTSSDFARSLVTIKQLISIAKGCYPDVKEDISCVEALRVDDLSVQPLEKDPKRAFLYRIKTNWDEFSVQKMSLLYRSQGTDEHMENFELLSMEFTSLFDKAVMLYLSGDGTSSDQLDRTCAMLEELLMKDCC